MHQSKLKSVRTIVYWYHHLLGNGIHRYHIENDSELLLIKWETPVEIGLTEDLKDNEYFLLQKLTF